MTLSSPSQFRGEVVGPYDEQGNLNPFWVAEAEELVGYACDVQAGKCPTCRATAEYWELGDSTVYPPGWWVERAIILAREESVNVKKALQMIFGTALSSEFQHRDFSNLLHRWSRYTLTPAVLL